MPTKTVSSRTLRQQKQQKMARRKELKQAGLQKIIGARERRIRDHNSPLSREQEERISGAVARAIKLNGLKPSDFSQEALVYLRALGRHEFKYGLGAGNRDKTVVTSFDLARSNAMAFFNEVGHPGTTITVGEPFLGPRNAERWQAIKSQPPSLRRQRPYIQNKPGSFTRKEADAILFTLQDEIEAIFQRSRKGRQSRK
ncbi:MAG: hypothetical protein NT067_01825 [Candidatus Diapherotrites archaeon]|nr:hypothetical protein [Candidatus Diapherotrites archaeon]